MPWTPPDGKTARRSRKDLSPAERTAVEAEEAEFAARFNAQTAADPKARAASEAFQRAGAAHYKRSMNVLRRLGYKGELGWPMLMQAWRDVGLSIESFGRCSDYINDFIRLLEAKADLMEKTSKGGSPTSELLRKKALKIGRPKGKTGTINIRGDLLRARRGDRTLAAFARFLRIPRSTYQRIESDCLATEENAREIAGRLELDLQELVRQ
jgi:hypothetical protein